MRRAFARRLSEDDPGLAIDLAEHSTVNALRAELANRFRLVEQPRHPRDLQVLLGATDERLVCLFLNAHRAAPDALNWLVSALLDSMAGGTGRGRSFLVEGAVDVDTVLDRTFGAGRPSVPSALRTMKGSMPAGARWSSVRRRVPKPVAEVRIGRVKAAIWSNDTEGGTRHNVTFSRLYKDGEEWKSTQSFGRNDLLVLAKVAD